MSKYLFAFQTTTGPKRLHYKPIEAESPELAEYDLVGRFAKIGIKIEIFAIYEEKWHRKEARP